MKKLSLKNLKLEASDKLQRNQLKTVYGGYGGTLESGDCTHDCVGTGINCFVGGTLIQGICADHLAPGCGGNPFTVVRKCVAV